MKLSNALTILLLTAGMLCWSGVSAQAPAQKTTKPTTTGGTISMGDGSVHKKTKPVKKPTKPTGGTTLETIHDGTSNTATFSETKSKKKGSKGLKPINDGTSNTIMHGETINSIGKEPKPTRKSNSSKTETKGSHVQPSQQKVIIMAPEPPKKKKKD